MNLRYSVDGEDSWTDHTKTETGSAVSFPLSGLTAGTTYEVEAWLGSDTDNKVTETFTTSMAPSISSIGVGGITKTSATATVNIANPGDAQNTVNLRYSVDGEDSWTDHTKTETGSAVRIPTIESHGRHDLRGRGVAGKRHRQQGDRDIHHFNGSKHIFNRCWRHYEDIRDRHGEYKGPGTAQNTVNLRYSVDGEDSWTDHTKTETGT